MSEDKKNSDLPTAESAETVEKPVEIEQGISSGKDQNKEVPSNPEIDSAQSVSDENKKSEKSPKKKFGLILIVLIIVILAIVGGAYFGYSYLNKQNYQLSAEQNQLFETSLETLQQQVSELRVANQNFQRGKSSLQTSFTALQSESERQMQTLAQRISSEEAMGGADWTLAEVEYLLNIANQRLATNKDSQTAIQMLEQADSILLELAYPELTPVRRQISEDLTTLRLAKRIDAEGLYFELGALSSQLHGITDFSPEYITLSETLDSEIEEATFFQKLWSSLGRGFSYFVRVQSEGGEPVYLVSDEQALSRQLSIQLQLRHAQLALLSTQQAVYELALNSASKELTQSYLNNERAFKIAERLDELAVMNVSAEEMNIHGSIRALSSVVNQLSKAGE